jgi:hypothetical protein
MYSGLMNDCAPNNFKDINCKIVIARAYKSLAKLIFNKDAIELHKVEIIELPFFNKRSYFWVDVFQLLLVVFLNNVDI